MGGLNVFCQQYIGIIETKSIVNGIVKSYVFVLSKGWSCISSNNLYNNTIINPVYIHHQSMYFRPQFGCGLCEHPRVCWGDLFSIQLERGMFG